MIIIVMIMIIIVIIMIIIEDVLELQSCSAQIFT